MEYMYVLAAQFLGLTFATFLPYARKLSQGKIDQFDSNYAWHLIVSMMWQFGTSAFVYLSWQPPAGQWTDIAILVFAFAYGFGGNQMQKEVHKNLAWFKEFLDQMGEDVEVREGES